MWRNFTEIIWLQIYSEHVFNRSPLLQLRLINQDMEAANDTCSRKNMFLKARQNSWKILAANFIFSTVAG